MIQKSSECWPRSSGSPAWPFGSFEPDGVRIAAAEHLHRPERVLPLAIAEVVVVHAEGLLEHRGVRHGREGGEGRVVVEHEVAADDARAVAEPVGVSGAGRAQQQRRRVDGAGREHHHVGRVPLLLAVALDHDLGHVAAVPGGLDAAHERAGAQRHVRVAQRGLDAHHVGVGLRPDEAREAVARVAADAVAVLRVVLVDHDAERQVERVETRPLEVRGQLLDPGLVAHRRVRERPRGPGLARVDLALTMHVVELLGPRVVRLEVCVADRPRLGHAIDVLHPAEVLLSLAKQHRAVHLRVAPDVVVLLGQERAALLVGPAAAVAIAVLDPHLGRVPILLLPAQVVAPLEDEDALAGGRQRVGQGAAAGPGPDDDEIEVLGHDVPFTLGSRPLVHFAAS